MQRIDFNADWVFTGGKAGFLDSMAGGKGGQKVCLPHDAMLATERSADSPGGPAGAWYRGDTYTYTKTLFGQPGWQDKTLLLEFEGVCQNAMVFVNGQFAGKCPYAYSGFLVDIGKYLLTGQDNEIKVIAKTGMQKTSRWYSGGGIYRPVHLLLGGPLHIGPYGVKVTATDCDSESATVEVDVELVHTGAGRQAVCLALELRSVEGSVVARDELPATLYGAGTTTLRSHMDVAAPQLWSPDNPALYTCAVELIQDGKAQDSQSVTFGIRKLQIDRTHGLRINGQSVKLRGACVHHDSGVLGAATFDSAELRRAKRLKAAGFNAIRSAHNPASRAMLDACDTVGLLVMDELFDVWNESKADHDYSLFFSEWWRWDMESIVHKDYNHPSVILYTVGNEIPETGTAAGAAQNREMVEYFHKLDATRPVANCINGMFSVMGNMGEIVAELCKDGTGPLPGDINAMMTLLDANLDAVMRHDIVTRATEETFAGVDVCGYNYMHSRYEPDGEAYPNRIIVGSETNPDKIGYNWPLIQKLPYVLGDFVWTGWDYMGEAGVGKNDYDLTYAMYGPWPWFLAWCGDHDICGNRRPQSYYREIVWGLRAAPYLAVERPQHYNQPKYTTNWTWPDVVESWTWPGFEGKPIHAEVYSGAEEVELLLNGSSIAKARVGQQMPCKALFDFTYGPGELVAVAYKGGKETGRMALRTAGEAVAVQITAEQQTARGTEEDLVYLDIALVDVNGALNASADVAVSITVEGPAVLTGFGSANPKSLEGFGAATHDTFDGRAQAVLRTTGKPGRVKVIASTPGLAVGSAQIEIV